MLVDEKIVILIFIDGNDENEYLLFVMKKGIVKKIKREEFKNINKFGFIVIGLRDDDEFIGVEFIDGK